MLWCDCVGGVCVCVWCVIECMYVVDCCYVWWCVVCWGSECVFGIGDVVGFWLCVGE